METQTKKPLGFTRLAPVEDKLQQIEKPEVKEIIEGKKDNINKKVEKLISNKMDAMKEYDLKPRTIAVKCALELKQDEYLKIIAKVKGRTKEDQATQYILEGLKRDYGIAKEYLKNLIEEK